jgi:hypothetical protein
MIREVGGEFDVSIPCTSLFRQHLTSFAALRQQPQQRVLFQPDTAPARQTRNSSTHTNSPQPPSMATSYPPNPSSDPNSAMFNIQSWEGTRKPHPMTMQAVITPGNNHELFRQRKIQEELQTSQKPNANSSAPEYPKPRHMSMCSDYMTLGTVLIAYSFRWSQHLHSLPERPLMPRSTGAKFLNPPSCQGVTRARR